MRQQEDEIFFTKKAADKLHTNLSQQKDEMSFTKEAAEMSWAPIIKSGTAILIHESKVKSDANRTQSMNQSTTWVMTPRSIGNTNPNDKTTVLPKITTSSDSKILRNKSNPTIK